MTGRVQLALNVNDLDESIAFYRKLFGTEPTVRRARTHPSIHLLSSSSRRSRSAHVER